MLSPRTKFNISRIAPFGVIWLFFAVVFLSVEVMSARTTDINPETAIKLTWQVVIFAHIAVTCVGLLIGYIEYFFIGRYFRNFTFGKKLIIKLIIYLLFLLSMIFLFFPIAASIESNIHISDERVWAKFGRFLLSLTFLNTMFQMGISLLFSLIYAGISDNIGYGVMNNFFLGKYVNPRQEERIFMFLDMKNSTSIAEKIGHVRYFQLLKLYYDTFTNAIIDRRGEVYQYIGDEIVISWPIKAGLNKANCINIYFDMKGAIDDKSKMFIDKFGLVPDFKAGLHLGEVTTGEVGALKKEIVFTGDVLNASSRIQSLCNHYQKDLIISGDLYSQLIEFKEKFEFLDESQVKGKKEIIKLYSLKSEN